MGPVASKAATHQGSEHYPQGDDRLLLSHSSPTHYNIHLAMPNIYSIPLILQPIHNSRLDPWFASDRVYPSTCDDSHRIMPIRGISHFLCNLPKYQDQNFLLKPHLRNKKKVGSLNMIRKHVQSLIDCQAMQIDFLQAGKRVTTNYVKLREHQGAEVTQV